MTKKTHTDTDPIEVEPQTVKKRALIKLERELGVEFLRQLNDPKTSEIMLNPDGKLWVEKFGHPMRVFGEMKPYLSESVMKTIAAFHSTTVTYDSPVLEDNFPLDNSRFSGLLPPVVAGPSWAIRKKAVAIFTLRQYVEQKVITERQYELIIQAVEDHKNILIAGGTSSGKTTLLNAIVDACVQLNPDERAVIIEDTGELQCAARNYVQMKTSAHVNMTRLIKSTLRFRPDRILVGEVRGPEALDVLMTWNSGHPGGAATLHANDGRAALNKLEMYVSMHQHAPRVIQPLIAEATNMVINIRKTEEGRRVREILLVHGYENGEYVTESIT